MSAPHLYTLADARRVFQRQECAQTGHSWDILSGGFKPVAIICGSCGWRGSVDMDEYPSPPKASA